MNFKIYMSKRVLRYVFYSMLTSEQYFIKNKNLVQPGPMFSTFSIFSFLQFFFIDFLICLYITEMKDYGIWR